MSPPSRRPLWWIPTLYLAEGLPSAVVTGMAAVALLDFGHTAAETAVYTSVLSLPWAFKPFWAPVVQRLGTRRGWVLAMQAALALIIAALAFSFPEKSWLPLTLGLLAIVGFASATHDIAADGFYMLALDEHRQAEWTGLRNTFFRVAVLAGNGGLVWCAGRYEKAHGVAAGWTLAFALAAAAMGLLAIYDYFAIPRLAVEKPAVRPGAVASSGEFLRVWKEFVQKAGFGRMLAFILLYRFAEGQAQGANRAFFLAKPELGGLGLGTDEVGRLYGTLGVLALMVGGILGGVAIARTGLRRQLWPMALAMNLPNILYVWMAWAHPPSRAVIGGAIFIEQFGYGYGFAAFMVYLLYVARGPLATAHYAICSALMAVGVALAGAVAAAVLEHTEKLPGGGYRQFFCWVMACTLVSFAVLWKLPLQGDFGRKTKR
jgi:PAT family beta-lactamase induction signal transducer AmpG